MSYIHVYKPRKCDIFEGSPTFMLEGYYRYLLVICQLLYETQAFAEKRKLDEITGTGFSDFGQSPASKRCISIFSTIGSSIFTVPMSIAMSLQVT